MGQATASGRGRLFWQVSALVLVAVGAGGRKAEAATGESAGGLTIDLQGQYTFSDSPGGLYGIYGGSTEAGNSQFERTGALKPGDGYDVAGTVTYQQPGTPWSFGVGVRYGSVRGGSGHAFISTYPAKYRGFYQNVGEKLSGLSHLTVDFTVGKDVGVGLWGTGVTTVGAGVRYAQFDATVTGSFATASKYFFSSNFRQGKFSAKHTTDAVGPRFFVQSISPIPGGAGFSLGAGAGVGVLFGRQTVHTDIHLSSGAYVNPARLSRSSSATIPTVDGYAQLNWAPPKSDLSVGVGYRVDAYFSVMDAGFAAARQINVIEHGPYLDLSITVP